jgi:uncharacterized protein YndB with AHSA1/START domain
MTAAVSDRIQKTVTLRAPRARVWRALSDSREFGEWFGVRFDGPFKAGAPLHGVAAPTKADPEVAKHQQPYAGLPFDITVDRVEPERLLSFRWHPFAIEKGVDYSAEPTTLVVFEIEDAPGGTKLTVTESGFDRIPLERRAKAFAANEQGWSLQVTLIQKHLASHAG